MMGEGTCYSFATLSFLVIYMLTKIACSIPTRRELVKSAIRSKTHSELRDSRTQTAQYHWTYCALSKRPLASPIVSDYLGRLYNKDAIIEWILKGVEAFGDGEEVLKGRGVTGLKDVVVVQFQAMDPTPGEEANGNGTAEQTEGSERKERWVCPITRKELGTGARAVYLVPCGCAFAEVAIKETLGKGGKEGDAAECLSCGKPYNARDVININPTADADIALLQARMKELVSLGLIHSLKKASGEKSKKRKIKGDAVKEDSAADGTTNGAGAKKASNITTASLTSTVLAGELGKAKVRRLEMSDSVKSLFTSSAETAKSKNAAKGRGGGDFMTRGYTLPN